MTTRCSGFSRDLPHLPSCSRDLYCSDNVWVQDVWENSCVRAWASSSNIRAGRQKPEPFTLIGNQFSGQTSKEPAKSLPFSHQL